jgi:hypothetical protein
VLGLPAEARLDAGVSRAKNAASQPKWSAEADSTGSPSLRPITAAISLVAMASSATP